MGRVRSSGADGICVAGTLHVAPIGRRLVGIALGPVCAVGLSQCAARCSERCPGRGCGAGARLEFAALARRLRGTARALDARTIEARWQITDKYYMYRDKFKFAAEGGTLGTPQYPPGKVKDDENFGKVETYRNEVKILLPVDASRTVAMGGFGESAPGNVLLEHFGFTVDNVVNTVKDLLA